MLYEQYMHLHLLETPERILFIIFYGQSQQYVVMYVYEVYICQMYVHDQ